MTGTATQIGTLINTASVEGNEPVPSQVTRRNGRVSVPAPVPEITPRPT